MDRCTALHYCTGKETMAATHAQPTARPPHPPEESSQACIIAPLNQLLTEERFLHTMTREQPIHLEEGRQVCEVALHNQLLPAPEVLQGARVGWQGWVAGSGWRLVVGGS